MVKCMKARWPEWTLLAQARQLAKHKQALEAKNENWTKLQQVYQRHCRW